MLLLLLLLMYNSHVLVVIGGADVQRWMAMVQLLPLVLVLVLPGLVLGIVHSGGHIRRATT
jgi:hypothetical protein